MSIGTDIDCFCPGFNRFLGEEARPAKSRQAVRAGLGDELPVAEVGGDGSTSRCHVVRHMQAAQPKLILGL